MNTLGRIGRMGEAWGRGFRTRLKTVVRYLKVGPATLYRVYGASVGASRAPSAPQRRREEPYSSHGAAGARPASIAREPRQASLLRTCLIFSLRRFCSHRLRRRADRRGREVKLRGIDGTGRGATGALPLATALPRASLSGAHTSR